MPDKQEVMGTMMEVVTLEPLRATSKYKEKLAEVVNHIPGFPDYPWINYLDPNDHVTSAHEGTHAINARLRMQKVSNRFSFSDVFESAEVQWRPVGGGRRVVPHFPDVMRGGTNGYYLMGGKGVLIPGVGGVTLQDVAKAIPREERGGIYNLYLVQQVRYWNDTPLYVFDEVSAYTNGWIVGGEYGMTSREKESKEKAREMLNYARYACDLADQADYQSMSGLWAVLQHYERLLG